jgi:hypothetical protein
MAGSRVTKANGRRARPFVAFTLLVGVRIHQSGEEIHPANLDHVVAFHPKDVSALKDA